MNTAALFEDLYFFVPAVQVVLLLLMKLKNLSEIKIKTNTIGWGGEIKRIRMTYYIHIYLEFRKWVKNYQHIGKKSNIVHL